MSVHNTKEKPPRVILSSSQQKSSRVPPSAASETANQPSLRALPNLFHHRLRPPKSLCSSPGFSCGCSPLNVFPGSLDHFLISYGFSRCCCLVVPLRAKGSEASRCPWSVPDFCYFRSYGGPMERHRSTEGRSPGPLLLPPFPSGPRRSSPTELSRAASRSAIPPGHTVVQMGVSRPGCGCPSAQSLVLTRATALLPVVFLVFSRL